MKDRSWRWEPAVAALLAAASIVIGVFFARNAYTRNSWDAEGHLHHARIVAGGEWLPPARACWQCYHPPLYYWVAGGVVKAAAALGADHGRALQCAGAAFYFSFLFVALAWIRRTVDDPRGQVVAAAAVLFWPSGFIHSVRIGNDTPFYLAHAAALLTAAQAAERGGVRPWAWAALFSAAALLVKANGFVTMAVVASAMALARPAGWRAWAAAGAIAAAGVALFLGVVHVKGKLTNAHDLPRSLAVQNRPVNFLVIEPAQYFRPFVSTVDDRFGRQYVATFLLKSSLFGEYGTRDRLARTAASAANVLFLGVLLVMGVGAATGVRSPLRRVHALNVGWSVAMLYGYRAALPYSSSGDFRYIYPMIVSAAVFFADGVAFLDRRRRWGRLLARTAIAWLAVFLAAGVVVVTRL